MPAGRATEPTNAPLWSATSVLGAASPTRSLTSIDLYQPGGTFWPATVTVTFTGESLPITTTSGVVVEVNCHRARLSAGVQRRQFPDTDLRSTDLAKRDTRRGESLSLGDFESSPWRRVGSCGQSNLLPVRTGESKLGGVV